MNGGTNDMYVRISKLDPEAYLNLGFNWTRRNADCSQNFILQWVSLRLSWWVSWQASDGCSNVCHNCLLFFSVKGNGCYFSSFEPENVSDWLKWWLLVKDQGQGVWPISTIVELVFLQLDRNLFYVTVCRWKTLQYS